jgi:hypothetical protein
MAHPLAFRQVTIEDVGPEVHLEEELLHTSSAPQDRGTTVEVTMHCNAS